MKQKNYKSILLSTLLCGGLLLPSGRVLAEEELVVFDMDPMVITAQRVDTKELDTPASIEIYDAEKIEKSGGANAYDVLKNTLGVITQSQGINGASMGTMTSKLMIRGIEKGTLVLVNGVSVNLDGKYSLDNIPSESIEKI
ncbi:MAG: TonB-dependent receptor plug domain-containing protein, partial [Acidaminococcaceae bacterium]|nr:TonB-dependent receptor plug domain-containing protein [Acidaminococcaceae bacterium]